MVFENSVIVPEISFVLLALLLICYFIIFYYFRFLSNFKAKYAYYV